MALAKDNFARSNGPANDINFKNLTFPYNSDTQIAMQLRPLIVTLDRAQAAIPISTDPRRMRTRAAILAAAQKLFADCIADAVSVEDITEAAGIAKGSFYNHFADKNQLAIAVGSLLHGHIAELIDRGVAPLTDPAVHCVRGTMIQVRFAVEHPESAKALLRLSKDLFSVDAPLNTRALTIIQDGISDATFNDIGVEDGLVVLVGIARMMMRQVVDGAWNGHVRETAQRCCTSMLRALGVKLAKARRISEFTGEDLLAGL